jgi:hypothetical protein
MDLSEVRQGTPPAGDGCIERVQHNRNHRVETDGGHKLDHLIESERGNAAIIKVRTERFRFLQRRGQLIDQPLVIALKFGSASMTQRLHHLGGNSGLECLIFVSEPFVLCRPSPRDNQHHQLKQTLVNAALGAEHVAELVRLVGDFGDTQPNRERPFDIAAPNSGNIVVNPLLGGCQFLFIQVRNANHALPMFIIIRLIIIPPILAGGGAVGFIVDGPP